MDEANKMNTMVRQLLTLNALESGNDMVTMERFDLVELLLQLIRQGIYAVTQNADFILGISLVWKAGGITAIIGLFL
mgnify:CR=1 FL=1